MTKTIRCVQCGQHKEEDGFGKKQRKSTNPSPTCLVCADQLRYAAWVAHYDAPGDGSGPLRACRFCEELKGQSNYTKMMWKSDAKPVCSECKEIHDQCAWALGDITREKMLLRCHATEELDILLKYDFLSWQDVTIFLADHSDDVYAQIQGFSPGPAYDGEHYSANDWLVNYARNHPSDYFIKSLVADIARRLDQMPGLDLWHLTA